MTKSKTRLAPSAAVRVRLGHPVIDGDGPVVASGRLERRDFRRFVSENPARLHKGMNPDFFKSTVVAEATARI